MGLHKSLKGSTKIHNRRNVLKRYERIDKLIEKGKWKLGDKAVGLPKIRVDE